MKVKYFFRIVGLIAFVNLLLPASSQAGHFAELARKNRILAGTSLGFSLIGSEAFFLTDLSADYFLDNNFSLGGQMLFAVGDPFVFAPQAVAKYTFDLTTQEDWLNHLKPYVEVPLGMVVSANGSTEAGFLGGFGFGGDVFLNSRWALGTNFLFQFSNEVGGENFGFFWKVLTAKYLF